MPSAGRSSYSATTGLEPHGSLTRRRGLLLLTVLGPAGLLAACTSQVPSDPETSASATVSAPPDLAGDVAGEEAALIALYETAISALPTGASTERTLLERIRDEHASHRLSLTSAPMSGDIAPVTVTRRDLITAERRATRSRVTACSNAEDPELARLLAFIGASEAGHVAALRTLA